MTDDWKEAMKLGRDSNEENPYKEGTFEHTLFAAARETSKDTEKTLANMHRANTRRASILTGMIEDKFPPSDMAYMFARGYAMVCADGAVPRDKAHKILDSLMDEAASDIR